MTFERISTIFVVFCGGAYTLLWDQAVAQTIMLSSQILHDQENVAKPQQLLVFTCVTAQSGILEWRSDEYIGRGIALQLLSINCVGRNFSSGNNLAIGTCVNVTNDGGTEVIVSELYVVASLQHPTSTVTCRNNGVGTSMQIRFNTTEPPTVALTTSLNGDKTAMPQQPITFLCITRNTGILEWFSPEYIGGGSTIQLLSINCVGTNITSGNAIATCKSVTDDNGVEIIESELYITASELFPRSTVTCINNGHGSSESIQFQIVVQKPATTTNSVIMTTTRKVDETSNTHTHITDVIPKKSMGVYTVVVAVVVTLVVIAVIGVTVIVNAVVWKVRHKPKDLKQKSMHTELGKVDRSPRSRTSSQTSHIMTHVSYSTE